MSEQNEPDQDKENSDSGKDNGSLGYLRGVCIAAAWAFIGLLLTAIFWPNLTERTKFFTGNLFNLVIAFAVIAQVIVYLKQTRIMTRQLKATELAAETTKQALYIAERPYLDVAAFKVLPIPFEVGVPITYTAKIQNTGRTPAYGVWGGIYLTIRESEILDETGLDYPEFSGPISKSPISSGRHNTRHRTTPDLRLTKFDVERLNDGRLFLYVYGVEFYKDSFTPNTHRLAYCQQYNRLTNRMEVSAFHNDSD